MKQLAVVSLVGDIVMNDQVAFDIDDILHIVRGELRCATIAHRSRVRLSEDDDIRVVIAKLGLPPLPSRPPAVERADSLGKSITKNNLIRDPFGRMLIGDVEAVEIVGGFRFGMRNVPGKAFGPGNVLGAGPRPHLGAIRRDLAARDQSGFATEADEGGTGADYGVRVVMPECGDRPVVGRHAPHQPDSLEITLTDAFQIPG